jgi:hypothetical protein
MTGEFKNNNSTSKLSSNQVTISYERGITDSVSTGLSTSYSDTTNMEGLSDINLFAKAEYKNFFTTITYVYSREEITMENNSSGGNHIILKLGYLIFENFGANLNYTPEYKYSFKNDSVDYNSGTLSTIELFYEMEKFNNTFGTSVSRTTKNSNEEDGEANSSTTTTTGILIYANLALGDFEVIPSIGRSIYDETNKIKSGHLNLISIKARYKF